VARPETILNWNRKQIAKKFDGSKLRKYPGRPRIKQETESQVVRMARENSSWGYHRLIGALGNLGRRLSAQTVCNILKRHGLWPAPKRKQNTTWRDFIRAHKDVLAATDFFTTEVITLQGLVTYYVLFFAHVGTRKIHIAGITPYPDEEFMEQAARNATMEGTGFLTGSKYLIHDRDTKYCAKFSKVIDDFDVKTIKLPIRSPNLNAYAERWVRSIKEECLSRLIFFRENSLRRALQQYCIHYHKERNHQGMDNLILFPNQFEHSAKRRKSVQCRERLGGLLKYYHQSAA
jgi:transposase InsO family protein